MRTMFFDLRNRLPIVFVAVIMLALLGCSKKKGSDDPPPPPPAVLQSIDIVPNPTPNPAQLVAVVPLSGTRSFSAIGKYLDNTTKDLTNVVTWNSSATTIATVNNTGLVTGLQIGTSTLTAISGGIIGNLSLQVSQATNITVTPANPWISLNTPSQFTAMGTLSDGTIQDFTSFAVWTSSSSTIATMSTSTKGLALVGSVGTTTISASVGGTSGTTTLQATNVTAIAITPANSDAFAGTTNSFTAIASFSNSATTENVTQTAEWSTSNTTIATIDKFGVATVSPTATTATVTISATFQGRTGTTSINVISAVLQKISVTPTKPILLKKLSKQFTATGQYNNGPSRDITANVTWSSSAPATTTITNTGKATGLSVGTATITAMLGSITGQTVVTVLPGELTALTIKPVAASMAKKTKMQFTAEGKFDTGGTYDMTSSVTWSSSNVLVAQTDASGIVTASSTIGTTTIKADFGTTTSTSTLLTVTNADLVQISVIPHNDSIPVGIPRQFQAMGIFFATTTNSSSVQDLGLSVAWSSSQVGVAYINSTGLLTARAIGTTTVTATPDFAPTTVGTTTLTVNNSVLQGISVKPSNTFITDGNTQQFNAVGVYNTGSTEDLTALVGWSSSSPSFATIDTSGLATALLAANVGEGETTITASFQRVTGTATLGVMQATLDKILILPATTTSIPAGITRQYIAQGVYSNGAVQDLTGSVIWGSSSPATATVDTGGLATAINASSTVIKASFGTLSGTTTLIVNTATITSITVTPTSAIIGVGTTLQYQAVASYNDSSSYNVRAFASWRSGDTAKATVIPAGQSAGLVTGVTASTTPVVISADFLGVTGNANLNVIPLDLNKLLVTPTNTSIHKGEIRNFTATAYYNDTATTTQDFTNFVTWSSSIPSFATISNSSGSKGLLETINIGTTTVKAVFGQYSGTTTLTVLAPVPSNLALGKDHTCVRLTTGVVKCFGSNVSGQVGNGKTARSVPRPESVNFGNSSSASAKAISAGGLHTCAILINRTISCWGENESGQLGNGSTGDATTPVRVSGVLGATLLTTGGAHTCAVFESGLVKCWGANNFGQLGDGSSAASSTTGVFVSNLFAPSQISAGTSHTCALEGGVVKCWGDNSKGQLGVTGISSSNIPVSHSAFSGTPIAVSAGGSHTCVRLDNNTVQCWGDNSKGQLGDSSITNATAISAGGAHTCALLSGGTVRCWGDNSRGQFGNGTTTSSSTPMSPKDQNGDLTGVQGIATGGEHTCALFTSSTLSCWGENKFGQVGNNKRPIYVKPLAVPNMSLSTSTPMVSTGSTYTCASPDSAAGSIFCFGENKYGNLGDGTTVSKNDPLPVVVGIANAMAISAGGAHACALLSDGNGTAKCWGYGGRGELGNGTTSIITTSTPVSVLLPSPAKFISAGSSHSCAVLTNGQVFCWGTGLTGQLGNNDTINQATPVRAGTSLLADVVSAGGQHTCSLNATDGTISCWGSNELGQLGPGLDNAHHPSPIQISFMKAKAISVGASHTCAISRDSATLDNVYCWGKNDHLQLGHQDATSTSPSIVLLNNNPIKASSITTGSRYSCAVLLDTTVACWGANDFGQLGNGNFQETPDLPALVTENGTSKSALTNVRFVSANGSHDTLDADHTCAVILNGTVNCWGDGFYGQIGSGLKIIKVSPVVVEGLSE